MRAGAFGLLGLLLGEVAWLFVFPVADHKLTYGTSRFREMERSDVICEDSGATVKTGEYYDIPVNKIAEWCGLLPPVDLLPPKVLVHDDYVVVPQDDKQDLLVE